jgi:23S rRNA (uracil1939-C5)-methyltransferase
VELYAAAAEDALAAIAAHVDLAMVGPPRAGMAEPAMRALLRIMPCRLAMISCEPATLARDSRALAAAGYRLESVTLFDLFPQTCHLESVSLWVKE